MLKMTIQGGWRPPYNILKFHLLLTGQLLVVKRWLLGEPGSHLTIFQISFITDWATVDGEGFHAHVFIYIFIY